MCWQCLWQCHAGHADCERRCLQRRGIHRHRHGAAHSGGNAGCRYRHAHSALPRLAYRFAAAGRDGLELYVPFCHDDACREGLWSDDRSRHCRRLRRRTSRLERKILAALCQPDCLGMCRDDHRLQSAFDRHLVVCKLVGLSHRRVAEPSGCGDYACGVPCVSLAGEGLLEAALRAVRSDCGLCCLAVFRHGRFCVDEGNRAGAGRHCPSQAFCLHAEV